MLIATICVLGIVSDLFFCGTSYFIFPTFLEGKPCSHFTEKSQCEVKRGRGEPTLNELNQPGVSPGKGDSYGDIHSHVRK